MSVSAHYEKLINSSTSLIEGKQAENEEYAQAEDEQKEALRKENKNYNRFKRELWRHQRIIDYYLRKNGGLFNLNEDQKCFYSFLLDQKTSLSSSLFYSKNSKYSLSSNITSLKNRQLSNYYTIFDTTLEVANYRNQANLFSRLKTT